MDLKPIDAKRIRKIDGKKSSFAVIEHSYRDFEKELSPQSELIYSKICLDADKNGMSFHSITGLKKRLHFGQDTIYKCIKILAEWGLILYEKREDGYAFQVLPVPNYDLLKQRHITNHYNVTKVVVVSATEFAKQLQGFDEALKDPAQKDHWNMLRARRDDFLKEASKKQSR